MSQVITRFDGLFSIWSYAIGHGRLLLRRTKSATQCTRVDILFKDVGYVCLPTTFEYVCIEEAASREAERILIQTSSLRMKGRKVFQVSRQNWRGFVVAGVVVWHEDEREYDEPSALLA
jgi:hypothetical protein